MKKQIVRSIPVPTDVVLYSALKDEDITYSYFGVDTGDVNGGRGVVTRTTYSDSPNSKFGTGNWTFRIMRAFTAGNGFPELDRPTFTEFVKALSARGFQLYQFDTAKELFDWATETARK